MPIAVQVVGQARTCRRFTMRQRPKESLAQSNEIVFRNKPNHACQTRTANGMSICIGRVAFYWFEATETFYARVCSMGWGRSLVRRHRVRAAPLGGSVERPIVRL